MRLFLCAVVLALLAPLAVRGDEVADLLQARLESTLEKHHKTRLVTDPCLISQTAFNSSTDALLTTTVAIYSTVLSNSWATPKCPLNPALCSMPSSSTPPADIVAVFQNLELPYGTQPTLLSLFEQGNSEIADMTVSCENGAANSCSWSSNTAMCGKTA